MTIKEIKQYLGIDISIANRNTEFVILRCIYVEQQLKKRISHFNISKELNCTHASIYNLQKKLPIYKEHFLYNLILKSYNYRDKILFNTLYDLKKEIIKQTKKEYNANRYDLSVRIFINKEDNFKRFNPYKIIDILKKDNKNKLWNKPMNLFDANDYKILLSLENGTYFSET